MINISDNQPDDSTIDEEHEILSSALLAQEIQDRLDKDGKTTFHLKRDEPSHHPKNELANALNDYLKKGEEVIPDLEDQDPDYNYSSYIPGEIDHIRYDLLHKLHDKGVISVIDYRAKEEIADTGNLFDQVQFYIVSVNTKIFPSYYEKIIKEVQPYIEAYIKRKNENDETRVRATDSELLNVDDENIKYLLEYSNGRELTFNGKQLAKTQYGSENDLFLQFIFAPGNAWREVKIDELLEYMGQPKLTKTIHQILSDLRLVGNLKIIFMPIAGSRGFEFHNPITNDYAKKNKLPEIGT
jgi:hypothetical protein